MAKEEVKEEEVLEEEHPEEEKKKGFFAVSYTHLTLPTKA